MSCKPRAVDRKCASCDARAAALARAHVELWSIFGRSTKISKRKSRERLRFPEPGHNHNHRNHSSRECFFFFGLSRKSSPAAAAEAVRLRSCNVWVDAAPVRSTNMARELLLEVLHVDAIVGAGCLARLLLQ